MRKHKLSLWSDETEITRLPPCHEKIVFELQSNNIKIGVVSKVFKVISSAESKEAGYWDIVSNKTGEVVACITTYWGFNVNKKQLKVKDKVICDIKNQDEAIVRLIEFFVENEREIKEMRNNHSLMLHNLSVVEGHYTYNLILNELKVVEDKIKKLEEYSLS